MASAASNQTIGSASESAIFTASADGGKCARFKVYCKSSSSNPVLLRVPGLHKDGEQVGLAAGESIEFQLSENGIAEVYAQGSGGNAAIDYAVTAKLIKA